MAFETCPKCNHRLGPPLKTSGRQVCMKCGWSDRPRQNAVEQAKPAKPARDLSPEEIQKILSQAAAMSLNNMKPKSKQDQTLAEGKPFPFLEE